MAGASTPLTHRLWLSGTLVLMLAIALDLTLSSFFRNRLRILDHSELLPQHSEPTGKVIFVVFDALREDYIEWPSDQSSNLDRGEQSAYTGKKANLFRHLVEDQPENSFLVPLRSEMPTVAAAGMKTLMSGVLSSVQDYLGIMTQGEFQEDSILYQLHQKQKDKARIHFYGDEIWGQSFSKLFTTETPVEKQEVHLPDYSTNDEARKNLKFDLENGSNFDFIVAHLDGLNQEGLEREDRYSQVEKKLLDAEEIVEMIVNKMDDDTTIVVFGDQGMSQEGSSELEMRNVMFAYQKKPFALGSKYRENQHEFSVIDSMLKQADLASIGSVLFNTPMPFSNIGVTHPIFTRSDDLGRAVEDMRENVKQIHNYLKVYCDQAKSGWCSTELAKCQEDMALIDKDQPKTDIEQIKKLESMSIMMNTRYKDLTSRWLDHDMWSLGAGIVMAISLFVVHVSVSFSQCHFQHQKAGLVGLGVNFVVYLGSCFELYSVLWSALVCMIIVKGQTWRYRSAFARRAFQAVRNKTNLRPKGLVYPSAFGLLLVAWCTYNLSDLFIEFADLAFDCLTMSCVAFMWLSQPQHLRRNILPNVLAIVACIKLTYINDKEQSHHPATQGLSQLREQSDVSLKHLQFMPLLLMYFLEDKIATHYSFGKLFRTLAHILTTANIVYQVVVTYNNLQLETYGTPQNYADQVNKEQREQVASIIGFIIYTAVIACIMLTVARTRFMQGKSWDNVSVRCGLFLAKACMLLGGKCGSMVYVCLVLQTYNFALIVNKRRDNDPGQSLPIQVIYAYFSLFAYFLRTGHRDNMSSLHVGRVCPGYTGCGKMFHHSLLMLDTLGPFMIGLLLLPLIVRARVQYVFAHQEPRRQAEEITEEQVEMKAQYYYSPVKQANEKEQQAESQAQSQRVVERAPAVEFTGSMKDGMNLFTMIMLLQVVMVGFYILHTHQQLIFTDRIAPKFAFDMIRAILTVFFSVFWILFG